jgi:hypothetical protein
MAPSDASPAGCNAESLNHAERHLTSDFGNSKDAVRTGGFDSDHSRLACVENAERITRESAEDVVATKLQGERCGCGV